MNAYFLQNANIRPVAVAAIAAATDVTSSAVDMANVESVTFVGVFGTGAANNTLKLQQSNDLAGTPDDYTDMAGTSVALGGASDEVVAVEVRNPTKRYVRAVAVRGTSSTLDALLAITTGFRSSTQATNSVVGTIASETHASPAEGTA